MAAATPLTATDLGLQAQQVQQVQQAQQLLSKFASVAAAGGVGPAGLGGAAVASGTEGRGGGVGVASGRDDGALGQLLSVGRETRAMQVELQQGVDSISRRLASLAAAFEGVEGALASAESSRPHSRPNSVGVAGRAEAAPTRQRARRRARQGMVASRARVGRTAKLAAAAAKLPIRDGDPFVFGFGGCDRSRDE